jgi:REP-associated tyrosine transposase
VLHICPPLADVAFRLLVILSPGMPYGLKGSQQSKQCHFVTFSCYRRLPRLRDGRICDLFAKCLERTRSKYRFRVYGYVVMSEHVHLLVSEPEL